MNGKRLLVEQDGKQYWLRLGGQRWRCAVGKGGIRQDKREGDGATPVGLWPLRELFYRADRVAEPTCGFQARPLKADDGWCDDPADPAYNRRVNLPIAAGHEALWREDSLYDVIIPMGFNDAPPVPGKGSAIFFHVAREDYAPTEGCVALRKADLLALLPLIGPGDAIEVLAPKSGI